jgi:predicted nucleic-acid-binding Zn-ribbon protein
MWCIKCGGRVFVDRVFSQKLHMELFCIMCGKRWMVNKETSAFGKWLDIKETENQKAYSISS